MKLIFKALLLCMLAVAVPFQGYAVAAMAACPDADAFAPPAAAPLADTGAEEHCMGGTDTTQAGHAGEHGTGADSTDGERGCPATCMAAAMHAGPDNNLLNEAHPAPLAFPNRFIPDVDPSRLERPPKHR